MKIAETLNKPAGVTAAQGKDDRKIPESRENEFQSKLMTAEDRNYEEKLQNLAARIIAQGQKLGEKVDIRELTVYKKLVSEFLGEAVNSSHKFSRESFLDRRGRHKVYAAVKKINNQLDDLTKDILKVEKDNIKILQRLDDIRGLIMDVMM